MNIDLGNACFFAEVLGVRTTAKKIYESSFMRIVIQVECNQEQTSFIHLLGSYDGIPIDCRSELEHLLLLGGFYELQPSNLYCQTICSNHRNWLLASRRRKNNCQLCVDVFNKQKRGINSFRRITKESALRVWHNRRLNMWDLILFLQSKTLCCSKISLLGLHSM